MLENWSIVLNVILLVGVLIALSLLVKWKREQANIKEDKPLLSPMPQRDFDEIIAVRKLDDSNASPRFSMKEAVAPKDSSRKPMGNYSPPSTQEIPRDARDDERVVTPIVLLLLAKDDQKLAGYELLQTLLAAGMRFGEGQLFHRHQNANGQGPVLFSLAAATQSGVFDLQNIGAFSANGLCLFMNRSGNASVDAERFKAMLKTAQQLTEDLNARLLDAEHQPFTNASIERYLHDIYSEDPEMSRNAHDDAL